MEYFERIKMLRMERGMSQDELAKRMGYADRSMLTKIEAGKVEITVKKLKQFAKVFNVDPAYLAGFSEGQENMDHALELSTLIQKASELDNADRARIAERIDMLLEQEKYNET